MGRAHSEMLPRARRSLISHRLASIHNSNKIIVLEDGKITTSGTHEDLLQNSPMYASLWKIQSTPS